MDKIKSSGIDRKTKEELFKDFTRNMEFNKDLNIFNGMDNNSRDARIMQALNSTNAQKKDFATNYMLSGLQFNGLKLGGMANGLLNTAEQSMGGKEKVKELKDQFKPENIWNSTKDYYKKNWDKYGWKTWKYHEW